MWEAAASNHIENRSYRVTSENETPAIDRQAIADQVIVSAGNILVAAGFGREEIGFFFRQAADHLAPVSPPVATLHSGPTGLSGIHAAFERSKPVSQLQPLIAQAQNLLPLRPEGPELKECFDLAMQMAPLLAEAQNGLRALAQDAGLTLFASREELMTSAGTLESPDSACLEDFEAVYRGAFEAIGAVADELLRRKDAEAFSFLLGHLAENSVVIDRALRTSVEKALQLLHA